MMRSKEAKSRVGVYFYVLIIMLILTAIFLNSFYWPYEGLSKRKLLVGMIATFGVVIFPIVCVKIDFFYKTVKQIIKREKSVIQNLKDNYKKLLVILGTIAIGAGLSGAVTYFVSVFVLKTSFNLRMFYLVLSISAIVLLLIFSWKTASKKPEKIFFCIAMIMGIFCIGVTPDKVGVSWDDQIHYQGTLEISNYLNGIMYDSDYNNITSYVYQHTGYDRETDAQYIEAVENSYREKECTIYANSEYKVHYIAYIPAAAGILLARGLGLSYIGVFNMGRLFNLLTYVSLVYLAIKRIKYGKVLIASVGVLPPVIFMASCYSYDPWVTGFIILGLSYFFAELQEDTLLQNKNIAIMIGAIVLGCFPKAIYFTLLFPLLFMPKKKFQSSKQRMWYYLAIVGGGLLLVASFLLPMFIEGAGSGDYRGGADVNSSEQIKFILKNPLAYAKILFNFDLGYISLSNSGRMLQELAYLGQGGFWGIVSLILAVVAFLDRGSNKRNFMLVKAGGLIGCTAALVLSTTALYISFTAVASETVAGMSGRYMIPTIYPALYSLGIEGTTHKINKNAFVCIPMLIIAATFFYNISRVCVIGY